MKNLLLILLLFPCTLAVNAQNSTTPNDKNQKYIQVTGSAEMMVVPDEIYLSITIKKIAKNGKVVDLDLQEKQLRDMVNALHIDNKNFTVADVYSQDNWYWNRPVTYTPKKEFQLMVNRVTTMDSALKIMYNMGVDEVTVSKVDNSKIEDYRLQVKMEAVKAAKAKAQALLGAIGESLGECLSIQESDDNGYYPYFKSNSYSNSIVSEDATNPQGSNMNYTSIKLRYEIIAQFKIK